MMLERLTKQIPNHQFIMADFDMLREAESALTGILAPVVSHKLDKSHEKRDYPTYLVPRGDADIFFPTDFQLLKSMYKSMSKQNSRIMKTYEFMDIYLSLIHI
eukprot:TRINITY_DN1453_c0_g1_i7.p3 TRINITY_DN1453_c0_g1~~TRINITY_DN1453_c0_g1_i7.p3  ORF type:complete len:103 (+),score=9.49 TRINITY_DN1453_c0_g1_i7:188-496(+)